MINLNTGQADLRDRLCRARFLRIHHGNRRQVDDFLHFRPAQRAARNDRRPMLIVVEDRDPHRLLQCFLDLEALRRLDVLQVDAVKGRLQELTELNHVVRIVTIDLKIEDVHVGQPFASMTGLPANAPMSPKPKTAVPLLTTATRLPRAV